MLHSLTCLATSLLLSLSGSAVAGTTEDWRSRSIYQVMTDRFARTDGSNDAPCDPREGPYCGGTWRGIINQLDYIQGMGFDAIYISPVTANLEGKTGYGEAYHGYWPTNIYAVNEHFGTEDDLHALSDEIHKRGMYLMVDVVINDMGFATNGQDPATSIDYSVFTPFNDQRFYHPWCNITDFDNYTEAQVCWLGDSQVALPDLNTESQEVSDMMNEWAVDLIAKYSIDGFRVDAAKHVSDDFLRNFAAAAGIFTIGEVYEGDPYTFCPYQDLMPSMTNYPNYFPMVEAFSAGNISALTQASQITKKTCPDTTALASFSENHDLPRFGSYTQDLSLLKSVLAWTILADGIPMIYQGQEQAFTGAGVPDNREALWTSSFSTTHPLYTFTTLLNSLRRHAIAVDAPGYLSYQSHVIYSDNSTVVFRKGVEGRQVVSVLSTGGERTGEYTLDLPTAYTTGTPVTDVVSCTNYTVNDYGQLTLPMAGGAPKVLFPSAKMNGSRLCGFGDVSLEILMQGGSAESVRAGAAAAVISAAVVALGAVLLV